MGLDTALLGSLFIVLAFALGVVVSRLDATRYEALLEKQLAATEESLQQYAEELDRLDPLDLDVEDGETVVRGEG